MWSISLSSNLEIISSVVFSELNIFSILYKNIFKFNIIDINNQNEKTANNGKWSEGFNNVGNPF